MKENLLNFKKKRITKSPKFNGIIDSSFINNLIGNYTFDNWGVCYLDISSCDFSNLSIEDMTYIAYSSSTAWPCKDKLPKGYNPLKILNDSIAIDADIKCLHNKGITGFGVTVAVIDSGFQGSNHIEFKDANLVRCTVCEENKIDYHFHMENVLSKLCGKNLGSAPDAKILFYETSMDDDISEEVKESLLDILNRIKKGENIKAVSCSFSLVGSEEEPYKYEKECLMIVEELKKYGCYVIDSSLFGENFFCCGDTFLNKDKDTNKYKIASFINDRFEEIKDKVNVVCSGKAVLEYCSDTGYKYEVVDCFSWTIPKVVGMYALCLQINSNINFEEFTKLSRDMSDINSEGMRIMNISKVIDYIITEKNKIKRKQ